MRIAIIGAGNVGQALAKGWSATHDVTFGVPEPTAERYRGLAKNRLRPPAAAASDAEVIVLATPWPKTEAAIAGLGSIAGKIVIDCTNPLAVTPAGMELAIGHDRSAGELVAQWAKGAFVFKTLNQTGAENMAEIGRFPTRPVMFVAGDDAGKKPIVLHLVSDLGFQAIDAGPLSSARLLEPLAMLWIDQALKRGFGRDFAFSIVRRG